MASTRAHALALASVLAPTAVFGNVSVQVEVSSAKGGGISGITPTSASSLAELERAALEGNRLLKEGVVKAVTSLPDSPEAIFPVFARSVVQFPNDNLADVYGNANLVAANAFQAVLAPDPGGFAVHSSTSH